MNDYEKAKKIMEEKKHIEELEEMRKIAAERKASEGRETMNRDGYVSRESAKLAAEQTKREKEERMKQDEREMLGLKESAKYVTYKKLREMYKKDSLFARLARRVRREAPDWKTIESYSAEALDYLDDVLNGRTYSQRKEVKRNQDAIKKMNKEVGSAKFNAYNSETLQKKNFAKFLSKLMMSETALKREIEQERKRKEADIALYGKDISR